MASQAGSLTPTVVGYVFGGHDNGARFFEKPPPSDVLCPRCSSVLDKSYRPTAMALRTKLDVSSTLDNVTVVSGRFVKACEDLMLSGITFHRFRGRDTDYFFAEATRQLPFDAKRRKTRFEGKCEDCGNFESVVGITPAYLCVSGPIERGFFETDIAFGSGEEKRPALIIDLESAIVFRQQKFAGLVLHKAEGTINAI